MWPDRDRISEQVAQLSERQRGRDANLRTLKNGRQSSKIRQNTRGRINNTTILITVLIFVLLHICLNFFALLSLQFAMFTVVQRVVHTEFALELCK